MVGKKRVAAVVVAAGKSRRMGFDKLMVELDGVPVLRRTVAVLDAHPMVDELVLVVGDNMQAVRQLFTLHPPQKPMAFVPGGACRAHSVAAGVAACPAADIVAIHDGARPFVDNAVITRVLQAAAADGAAAPALPVADTVKRQRDGLVAETLARENLVLMQTPQAFARAAFLRALAAVPEGEYEGLTDDCMVMERAKHPVRLVQGQAANIKITRPEDLEGLMDTPQPLLRVGHGYDVHRFEEGRKLMLGGVEVPFERGLLGHSDADVLLHAVADALLGAAALGDIGRHFPDSDPAFKDADSQKLLRHVVELLAKKGYVPVNVDATVVCQAPRLAPYIPAMVQRVSQTLGIGQERVNIKATTEEKLGFTGAGQGIAAHCVALLQKNL